MVTVAIRAVVAILGAVVMQAAVVVPAAAIAVLHVFLPVALLVQLLF